MKSKSLIVAFLLVGISASTATVFAAPTSNKVVNDKDGNLFMEDVTPTRDIETESWQYLYSAYSCVYHHNYTLATQWLRYALLHGAATPMFKSTIDIKFLLTGLNRVAEKQKQAAVTQCDALVLQALMQGMLGSRDDELDSLKRVVINNPTSPSIDYVKKEIRSMEFEQSDNWLTPSDVALVGGKRNRYFKWRMDAFPLKVYIPTDDEESKVAGYKPGDAQLLRSAFETWEKESGGKIRFVYQPVKAGAKIKCVWVSDQKDLFNKDAIGECSQFPNFDNFLQAAEIRILTFSPQIFFPGSSVASGMDNQFRINALKETCLHEIGHSLGLNHSTSENDVMSPHESWQPITAPTGRDLGALNSLYQSNVYEYISAALDAIDGGQYEPAFKALNLAISTHPYDTQTRETICACLNNAATSALRHSDFAGAIKMLLLANEFAAGSQSIKAREQVLKGLHYAYMQSGKTKEAVDLEKQNGSLLPGSKNSASYLDQYGLKRDALPYYEEAMSKHPDDKAIREKFCFLLLMLGKDDSNADNDKEGLSFLTRAKSLLEHGMDERTIHQVTRALCQVYLKDERFNDADQTTKDEWILLKEPEQAAKQSAEGDIAILASEAKSAHPTDWSNAALEKAAQAKLRQAYEQYVDALRKCAQSMQAKDESGWAAAFIVRHKQHDPKSALGTVFELRRRLLALTDERAVGSLECQLAFK